MLLCIFVHTIFVRFNMIMQPITTLANYFRPGLLPLIALMSFVFASSDLVVCHAEGTRGPLSNSIIEGKEGWLFFEPERRFVSFPCFWGAVAPQTSRSPKPETADPIPAIVNFHKQLAQEGIKLVLVPVPPKIWKSAHAPEYPLEGIASDSLSGFYKELIANGIHLVDLRPDFEERETAGEQMYCKTDTHWSGSGCVVAAVAVAKALLDSGIEPSVSPLKAEWTEAHFRGDLLALKDDASVPDELLKVRRISTVDDTALQPNPSSPILIIGDSHTLVFHDFLGDRAGLPDQVAKETGIIPDWIGTRGSGANAVRISLLRRVTKDPAYLASKKVVVWCFASRDFTESEQGWQQLPLRIPPKNP